MRIDPLQYKSTGVAQSYDDAWISVKKMKKKHLLVLVVEIITWRYVNCPHLEAFLALDGISPPLFRRFIEGIRLKNRLFFLDLI